MKRVLVYTVGIAVILAAAAKMASALDEKGYLGVFLGPAGDGAVVTEVVAGSPAEKAGLKPGDVIQGADDDAVKGPEDLRRKVQSLKAGDTLHLSIQRGTESLKMEVGLGSLPPVERMTEPGARTSPKVEPRLKAEREESGFLGIGFAPVPPVVAYHLGIGEDAGIMVGEVLSDSAAQKAGIHAHDIVLAINGKEIKSPEEFAKLVAGVKVGSETKLDIIQKGEKKTVTAVLGERPAHLMDSAFGPGFPRGSRGKLRVLGPDGMDEVFTLPDNFFNHEEILKELRDKFPELTHPESFSERLKGLLENVRKHRLMPRGDDGSWSSTESHSSVVKIVDGGYDVTVKDQNGTRTVTVKKDGKAIAEDLPYDQVKTLPEDVQSRIEKAVEGLKGTLKIETPALPAPPTLRPGEKTLKA